MRMTAALASAARWAASGSAATASGHGLLRSWWWGGSVPWRLPPPDRHPVRPRIPSPTRRCDECPIWALGWRRRERSTSRLSTMRASAETCRRSRARNGAPGATDDERHPGPGAAAPTRRRRGRPRRRRPAPRCGNPPRTPQPAGQGHVAVAGDQRRRRAGAGPRPTRRPSTRRPWVTTLSSSPARSRAPTIMAAISSTSARGSCVAPSTHPQVLDVDAGRRHAPRGRAPGSPPCRRSRPPARRWHVRRIARGCRCRRSPRRRRRSRWRPRPGPRAGPAATRGRCRSPCRRTVRTAS